MTPTAASILSITSIGPPTNHSHQKTNIQDKQFNFEWNILPTTIGYLSRSVNYKLTQDSAIGIFVGTQFNSNDNYKSSVWLAKLFMAYGHQEYKPNATKSSKSGVAIICLLTSQPNVPLNRCLTLGFVQPHKSNLF